VPPARIKLAHAVYEDIECGDEQLNLQRMIGSEHATALDWTVVELLGADGDEDELGASPPTRASWTRLASKR